MANRKELLDVGEVAQRLGISRRLAYQICRKKQIPGVIHLGKWRMKVSNAALTKLLNGDSRS